MDSVEIKHVEDLAVLRERLAVGPVDPHIEIKIGSSKNSTWAYVLDHNPRHLLISYSDNKGNIYYAPLVLAEKKKSQYTNILLVSPNISPKAEKALVTAISSSWTGGFLDWAAAREKLTEAA